MTNCPSFSPALQSWQNQLNLSFTYGHALCGAFAWAEPGAEPVDTLAILLKGCNELGYSAADWAYCGLRMVISFFATSLNAATHRAQIRIVRFLAEDDRKYKRRSVKSAMLKACKQVLAQEA